MLASSWRREAPAAVAAHSITWLCAAPPQPPTTADQLRDAGFAAASQQATKRVEDVVAGGGAVVAGRSASVHRHTCSARAQAGSFVGGASVMVCCFAVFGSEYARGGEVKVWLRGAVAGGLKHDCSGNLRDDRFG